MTGVTLSNVIKKYGETQVIHGIDLEIEDGEFCVFVGPSGCGKSTLLRMVAGLEETTGGTIEIGPRDVTHMDPAERGVAMVFQTYALYPHMTVAENVAFPLKMLGKSRAERRARAFEVLDMVGLDGREDSYPRQLSGGQKQRVGIARSLAVNPDIWFLDEPFSALDPLIRRQLQDEFLKIQSGLRKTIVFITHDITEALKLADRIAIMRDGRIVQIGTPAEIVLKPVDNYVREFSKDVARGRHACLDSVIQTEGPLPEMPDDPKLRIDMTLDDSLAACMYLYQPVPVYDRDGKMAGYVHPKELADALTVDSE